MKNLTIRISPQAVDVLNSVAANHDSLSSAVEWCILRTTLKGKELKAAMAERTRPGRPGRKSV